MTNFWEISGIIPLVAQVFFGLVFFSVVKFYWKWRWWKNITSSIPGFEPTFPLGNVPLKAIVKNQYGEMSLVILVFSYAMGVCNIHRKEKLYRFWIGPKPYIFLFNCESAEALLSSTSELNKTFEYNFLHDWLGTGLLTSTGQKWRGRRKMLTPSFHFRILEHFQEVFHEQSMIFVQKVKKLSAEGKALDITPLITALTLDVICDTAMGTKLGAQDSKNSEYVDAVNVFGTIFMERVIRPTMWPNFIFRMTPSGKTFYRNLKILHGFTDRVIKERRSGNTITEEDENESGAKRRLVFLDILLQEQRKDEAFTDEDIREEVDTFMFEGHDTTSVGLCWALFLIGNYQDVQKKIQEELHTIFGGDRNLPITSKELKEMKYLECVLKESQRLYPSVPLIARQLKKDLKIGKHLIPADTACVVFPPGVHRDPEIYPDPEVFNPDRFTPENSSGRHPYAFIPFSAGPRNCIGQRFALNEEKTVVAQCLRHFNIQSLDTRDKIPLKPELVSRPLVPIYVRFTERKD